MLIFPSENMAIQAYMFLFNHLHYNFKLCVICFLSKAWLNWLMFELVHLVLCFLTEFFCYVIIRKLHTFNTTSLGIANILQKITWYYTDTVMGGQYKQLLGYLCFSAFGKRLKNFLHMGYYPKEWKGSVWLEGLSNGCLKVCSLKLQSCSLEGGEWWRRSKGRDLGVVYKNW
jgi:hypothetical protein